MLSAKLLFRNIIDSSSNLVGPDGTLVDGYFTPYATFCLHLC